MLEDLEDEGAVERRGKRVHEAGRLPPVVLADIMRRDRDGELVAAPAEWDEARRSRCPDPSSRCPARPRPGGPAPGVGDRALLRVDPCAETAAAYTGRVIK